MWWATRVARRSHCDWLPSDRTCCVALVVHEPPLLDLLKGRSEFESMLLGFDARVAAVVELLKTGEMQAAAERFVETVAFGPGAWAMLPDLVRETFIRNAPTCLAVCNAPAG